MKLVDITFILYIIFTRNTKFTDLQIDLLLISQIINL